MKRMILVLPFLLVLPACSSIVGLDSDGLDFTAERIEPGSQEPVPDFGATGGEGRIRFKGAVETPVPCYEVDGGIETVGDRITLVVVASPLDVTCTQVLATFEYEGTLWSVDPGFYEVAIEHVGGDSREVVFEGAVEVE